MLTGKLYAVVYSIPYQGSWLYSWYYRWWHGWRFNTTTQREDEDTLPEILRLIEITELNERYQYVNTSSNCVLL